MNPLSYYLSMDTNMDIVSMLMSMFVLLGHIKDILSLILSLMCDGVGLCHVVTLLDQVTGIEPALFQIGNLMHHHLCVT